MGSAAHRLPPDRAERLEKKLRMRSMQLRTLERPRSSATPLGVCRTCARLVYSGDDLAMAGIYLLHADCCAPADKAAEAP